MWKVTHIFAYYYFNSVLLMTSSNVSSLADDVFELMLTEVFYYVLYII